MKILVVDDTQDNVMLLEAMLKKAGYEDLITATSAHEAYQKLGMNDEANPYQDIDVILMDLMMPEISGIEACEEIKSHPHYEDVPIIIITARTDSESIEAAFGAGACDYITKPFRKIELMARVRSVIALKKETDRRKQQQKELSEKNEELQKALDEIKVLRGFIPICAICKDIRDLQGYWQRIDLYLQEHSEAKLSHSICDNCMKAEYSDIMESE